MTVHEELAEIHEWWSTRTGSVDGPIRLAGSALDQLVPAGSQNPYWELVRRLPAVETGERISPDGHARGLPVGRHLLTRRYSWAIPSPGDLWWLADVLAGRGLVEIGAGTGYWAWQAQQAGIDVIAYEPHDPSTNAYVDGGEYVELRAEGHPAAARHPDRALLLCWPSHGEPWAAKALGAYGGDLLVYIGEGPGGDCADDRYFEMLDRQWTEIGVSEHHLSWWPTACAMKAYRRMTA